MPPFAVVTSTDFTYTGQRNLPNTGLMDYKARFYSPSLGRFIQPDTIIPGAANPQSWNRFSYVQNNPIRFNDPTGHYCVGDDEDCVSGEGGTGPVCYSGELVCQLKKGGYKPKTKEQIARDLRIERPVSGIHLGFTTENGFIRNTGGYVQWDFLMDWKNGVFYRTVTAGTYVATGTLVGKEVTGYAGWTTVHGLPLYGEPDISSSLAGNNFDAAISVAGDAAIKLGGSKGVSIDLDDSGKPVHTGEGLLGYQYAIENSIEIGGNIVPNEIDAGIEFGVSGTGVIGRYELPWWPFR